MLAVLHDHPLTVGALVELGADETARDYANRTAKDMAVSADRAREALESALFERDAKRQQRRTWLALGALAVVLTAASVAAYVAHLRAQEAEATTTAQPGSEGELRYCTLWKFREIAPVF